MCVYRRALFLRSDEEEGEGAGARVGADNRVHVVHHEIGDAESLGDLGLQRLDIFYAVSMRDEDSLILGVDRGLLHVVHERLD